MKQDKILIIAPPRSGTGYAAKCMQDIGLNVGHERLKSNGISSWLWAVDCHDNARWGDNYLDIKPDMTIMLYRRPEDVITSLALTAARALDWMAGYVSVEGEDVVERSSYAVSGWIEKCLERKPDYIVSLDYLPSFCYNHFGRFPNEELRGYNTRKHGFLNEKQLIKVNYNADKIRQILREYGDGVMI